jgi:hypothetical protein
MSNAPPTVAIVLLSNRGLVNVGVLVSIGGFWYYMSGFARLEASWR